MHPSRSFARISRRENGLRALRKQPLLLTRLLWRYEPGYLIQADLEALKTEELATLIDNIQYSKARVTKPSTIVEEAVNVLQKNKEGQAADRVEIHPPMKKM